MFITNAKNKKEFLTLTCNQSGKVRYDKMAGREYRVAPMVMIVEGVLDANAGPIYYPEAEISKFPGAWNNKPVVVYHPDVNTQGPTACTPEVMDTRSVGVIMNAHMGVVEVEGVKKPALKAEAWVEIDRAAIVDERVIEAIDNESTMELSTGLFVELERKEGEFESQEFIGIAHNFQPDHLALLPDLIGACPIAAGAGFIQNEATKTFSFDYSKLDNECIKWATDHTAQLSKMFVRVIENEMSFGTIRDLLWSKLNEANDNAWIDEVFSSFFVYEFDGKMFKQNYLVTDGVCSFVDDAVEVERVTEFRTKDGKFIGNRKDQSMEKFKIVDGLIANTSTSWDESDRETLMAMNEETLTKVANATEDKEKAAAASAEAEGGAESTDTSESVQNGANMSVDEYLDTQVPEELRGAFKSAFNTERKLKSRVIEKLTQNEACVFTAEYLESKDLEELQNLARLANSNSEVEEENIGVQKFDYSGQFAQNQAVNSSTQTKVSNEAPLGVVSLDD